MAIHRISKPAGKTTTPLRTMTGPDVPGVGASGGHYACAVDEKETERVNDTRAVVADKTGPVFDIRALLDAPG
ncbi:hypothetical protein GCM10022224_066210 [Nonomuraea antimicrobica]|uniref:Uncharacterized protein n=1 Tax=Nonomuraea antimicrobica TaxID=561173 RepID=A0ABP7CIR3_9ACTN